MLGCPPDATYIAYKLSELQRQIQTHHMHMNKGDTVQIEAPDFDPDINGVSTHTTDEKPNKLLIPTPEVTEPEDDSFTPATTIQQLTSQDTHWPTLSPSKSLEPLPQQPSQ